MAHLNLFWWFIILDGSEATPDRVNLTLIGNFVRVEKLGTARAVWLEPERGRQASPLMGSMSRSKYLIECGLARAT